GDEINAKISEVGESYIKYRKFNNQDGPIYTKSKDEIFYIKYSNGEKEMFSKNVNNKSSNNIVDKGVLISGRSIFNYTNTFEDDLVSTSNLELTASAGGFLTRNFVLGGSLSYQSTSTGGSSNDAIAIGPFIRGYVNDFYSQVGYAFSEDLNVFSAGVGYQVFLNKSKSVSLNPTILYFSRVYKDYTVLLDDGWGAYYYNIGDITQEGILIGCAFEIHL
ncbi:MAG: hypothetical protein H8E55_73205, partial [Pelagibacterales bacterium]|nr:hypothetical protein [Pelagibacterales bacterium]